MKSNTVLKAERQRSEMIHQLSSKERAVPYVHYKVLDANTKTVLSSSMTFIQANKTFDVRKVVLVPV